MTKSWYPVINHDNCIECGICTNTCTHGVFQEDCEKPVVKYPEECVNQCRGCQALCPAEAIQYFRSTGGNKTTYGCSCGS